MNNAAQRRLGRAAQTEIGIFESRLSAESRYAKAHCPRCRSA